jgi:hypothetical protein
VAVHLIGLILEALLLVAALVALMVCFFFLRAS